MHEIRTNKIWFITGASRGFGRVWAEAALERGDRVAATARSIADVTDLTARFGDAVLPLALDVTDTEGVRAAVARAHAHFGRLDVIVNNAGYALMSTVEEANDGDLRAIFETNVFGAQRVIKAALPFLRRQGHGHIVGVSSGLGTIAFPLIGIYCATKWAFEALHESLAQEVEPFGVDVTILEPGAYATDFGSAASLKHATADEAYADLRNHMSTRLESQERGDPRATAQAVLEIVDAERPPLRLFLGSTGLPAVRAAYTSRLAIWEAWEPLSISAQGDPPQNAVATG